MTSAVGVTQQMGAADACAEIRAQWGLTIPSLVVYFCSPKVDGRGLGRELRAAYPAARVVGCTSAGEIGQGRLHSGSAVAMALPESIVGRPAVGVVRVGGSIDLQGLDGAVRERFGRGLGGLDHAAHVGLLLVDGLSFAEEALMSALGAASDAFFVGGSAGDDAAFQRTQVFVDGAVFESAAACVVMEPRVPFGLVKTQSFRRLGRTLRATRVDAARRVVHEFDGRPALEAYADAIGVPAGEAAEHLHRYSLGLMVDGEPYVRSVQRAEGSDVVLYCSVLEGMVLEMLEAGDVIEDTRRALEAQRHELGELGALLVFDCILRGSGLRKQGLEHTYGAVFQGAPTAGFMTYGEQYLGHISHSATMIAFGR
jgi:hypothetical protein